MSVDAEIRLNDYSTIPLYNIKAVVKATGISSSTLRAWERRYHVCMPKRSDSGYRLYSESDIAVLRWLKTQIDSGMSISQAVNWLETLHVNDPNTPSAVLPQPPSAIETHPIHSTRSNTAQNLESLAQEFLDALLNYDEAQADDILSEAFALYSVEQVGEQLIRPSLVEIGERWHRAQLTVTVERFATNYTVQRLSALLRTVANPVSKPLIWVGCAPREFHEVGILLLAVYLRRAGFHVQYLGQNLYEKDLIQDVRKNRPDMLLLSASSQEGAEGLRQLALQLAQLEAPNVIVGYGGRIFNQIPELSYGIPGVFLGQSAQEAIETIGKLLYSPNVVLHMPNKPSGRASADHA